MKINSKLLMPAIAGLVLLFIPSLLDFFANNSEFKTRHSFLLGSFVNLLNFIAVAYFFTIFFRERNAAKQNRISTVAYRSLSQASNDALRKLIAPLNGANLYELALYDSPSEVWDRNRERLVNLGRLPQYEETKGLWEHTNDPYLKETLEILMKDHNFLKEFYFLNARVRRDTQFTTGLWSSVMFTSSSLEADLGRFRELSDDLEHLQELWRNVLPEGAPSVAFQDARVQFWRTIHTAFDISRDFAMKGALPSLERQVRNLPTWDGRSD